MVRLDLVIFIILVTSCYGSTCGGTRDEIFQGPSHLRHLVSRGSTLSPIRLSYQYIDFDMGDAAKNTYFKTVTMKAVDNFFTHALKVFPVQGNLVIPTSTCGSEIRVPTAHMTTGIENADIVVYIKTETLTGQSYVAYAGACSLDTTGLGNVIAGRVVINIPNFITSTFDNSFSTIAHEITHLLGFSSGLYSYWRSSTGSLYAPSDLTATVTVRGVSKTILKTPNVVLKAKEAFGCDSIVGIELEESGGSGTVGSHWDMRIMYNDFMIAHVMDDVIYSSITFALLKDTGWYDVDYTVSNLPMFGKNIGCTFFDSKCITNGISNFPELFCTATDTATCDFFSLKKSSCNIATYTSSLPTAFQYFSTSSRGGSDPYTDYCPYRSGYSNGDCRGDSTSTLLQPRAGEGLGLKSRCFKSTLLQSPYSLSQTISACYEVTACTATYATVKIGTVSVNCLFTGGTVSVTGYTGLLTCPSSDVLCREVPCKDSCYGAGKCVSGVCQCYAGYFGDTCSITCTSNCATCTATGCTACVGSNMIVSGYDCVCASGYAANSAGACLSTAACDSLCTSCSNAICSACTPNAAATNNICSCNTGYKASGSSCVACPNLCVSCTSLSCDRCVSNAAVSGNTCACSTGFYANGNSCVACAAGCPNCVSASQCSPCSTGSFYTNGQCVSCSNGCSTCTSTTQCTQCSQGYFLANNACFTCKTGCKGCNDASSCNSCLDGYYLSNARCSACSSGCLSCQSSSSCSSCSSGLFYYSGLCVTACPSGFYASGTSCNICSIANCMECTSAKCTKAAIGYSVTAIGTVVKDCPANCIDCTNGSCNTCNQGFYLGTAGCVQCDPGCSICSSTSCSACFTGYNFNNGLCSIVCPRYCLTCEQPSTCSFCLSGYFNSTSGCSACSTGCTSCTSASQCTTCSPGYTLTTSGSCALICPRGCLDCSSPTKCLVCTNGTYLTSNNTCSPCVYTCLTCTSASTCRTCLTGFSLNGNSMCTTDCPSRCSRCDSLGGCTQCNSGFILTSNRTCIVPCPSNCIACDQYGKCTNCSTGYFPDNGACTACANGCSECAIGNICRSCVTGYSLVKGRCVQCSDNCKLCTTAGKCSTCNDGFFLNRSLCYACISNCRRCSNGRTCTSCNPGYMKGLGGTCRKIN